MKKPPALFAGVVLLLFLLMLIALSTNLLARLFS